MITRFTLHGWLSLAVVSLTLPLVRADTSVLYWTDQVAGSDAMAGALSGLASSEDFAYTVTTAADDSDFSTKINSGDYDLGILFIQGSTENYSSIDDLAAFASSGGLAMYADWTARVNPTAANARAALFDFQYTGVFNEDSVTITDPVLDYPNSFGGSPLSLATPGWFDFSFGLSVEQGEGELLAQFGNRDGAVVRTFQGGRVMGFGMLNDAFADYDEGVAFFTNALVAIPEPATVAGILGAFALAAGLLNRRSRGNSFR